MIIENELDPTRFSAAAEAGLRVFPVKPRDKVPAVAWKQFQDRAPTQEELTAWDGSDLNLGVVCGSASGLVVLDVDSPEAQEVVDGLHLPMTPTVKTARGLHYYFRRPGYEIRNRVHVGGVELDVRGDGGYVVGAGSIHSSGTRYQWIVTPDECPFAPLPEALVALAQAKKSVPTDAGHVLDDCAEPMPMDGIAGWLNRQLNAAKRELGAATEGERNSKLFKVAVRLASEVAAAHADWSPCNAKLKVVALQIGLAEDEATATLASAWKRGSAEPAEWLLVARQWAWLAKPNMFYHLESGEHLKPEAFNIRFRKYRFDKKTLARHAMDNGIMPMVHDLTYEPRENELLLERDGLPWLNTYRPSRVTAAEGDATPLVNFMKYLVPEDAERQHLLQMMAWSVRFPGQKIRHALLFRSREQGIGKSMMTDIWGELLGRRNVRKTSSEEVSGTFQGFIKEKLLVVLEELNWGVGPSSYNRLKTLITEDVVPVNEKYMPVRHWPNYATFIILTNLPVPILIEDRDRRIFYIDSPAERRDKDYYREFVQWWRNNLDVVRAYIDEVDLSNFDPNAPPPMTAAKEALIAESQSELVKELLLGLEQRWGVFDRDIVTLEEIERQLGPSMRGKTRAQLTKALKDIGAVAFKQQRVPGHWSGHFVPIPTRASLWAIRNGSYWQMVDPVARGEEYARNEGLFAGWHGLAIEICHISAWPADLPEPVMERTGEPLTPGAIFKLLIDHVSDRASKRLAV